MGVSIASFSRDDKAADVAAALRRDGVAIVRELVAPEVMDVLAGKLAPELEEKEPGGGPSFGGRMKSTFRLFARGSEFSEQMLLNPLLLEVTDAILLPEYPMAPSAAALTRPPKRTPYASEDVIPELAVTRDPILGPNCHHYRVNVGGALQVWGGGTAQPLHREMDIYRPFLEHNSEQPEYILAMNWAGTDFTLGNGATRLVPGSHRWPQERKAEEHEVAQAVMPKGSVVFWLGSVLHGLGASRSDEARTGIIFTMVVNWLATEENQYLAVPPEVARTLTERAQQLLGYRSSPTLGWVPGLDRENMLVVGKSGPP